MSLFLFTLSIFFNQTSVFIIRLTVLHKYKKINKGNKNRPKLYKQVIDKALSITKLLYWGFLLFFLFNNAIKYFV